jgi:hypothetical protein
MPRVAPASGDHRETVQFFDMQKQLMPGSTTLIVGKRCSGKSILLFDIMSQMEGWFNYGMALSPTQSSRQEFAKCMPNLFIHRQSPERLEAFVTTVNQTYDKAIAVGKPTRASFLICDDTAFDRQFMRCKTLQEVFLNGRQFGLTCVIVAQYIMTISPALRGNSDFVFVFWDNNAKNQDKIWEFWFNMMDKKTFKEVFAACTQGYSCLVMDVRASATSRDWHDCVFWYKANTKPPPFTFCDRDFFLLNDHLRVGDSATRTIKASSRETVWRLGLDGRIFDAPSCMAGKQSDASIAADADQPPPGARGG